MSNRTINTGIGLNNIVAPNLNDVGYASNLNDTFKNINDNFLMLANNNFVQGARGESVKLLEVDIYNKETSRLTAYGEMILAAIKPEGINDVDYEPITISEKTINWYDNLYDEEKCGKLYLIADDTGNVGESEVIISSLYYTFIDARYSAESMGALNPDVYSTKRDTSCVLMWDATMGGFKTLNNAFPTIYYEKGVGLCWKINGANTGMPVKGLPGDDGASAVLQIVQCNELKYSDDSGVLVGEVTSAFDTYNGYVVLEEDKKKELNGSSVIVFAPLPKPDYIEPNDDETYYLERGFCFGQCIYDDTTGKVMVYCHDDSIVDRSFDINSINNVFKSISAYNSNIAKGLSGLFIPIDSINDTDNKQAVHLLTALKSTEAIEDASSKALELTLMPVNDIDSFQKAENPINIDKYLYLYIKPGMINYDEAKENLEKPCKFKLVEIIKNKESNYLKTYSSTNNIGSMVYKTISYTGVNGRPYDNVKLNQFNVVSIKDFENITYSSDFFDLIPEKFKNAIDENGLYCWQIANGANQFDPVVSYAPGTSAASIFNAIFTTELIPSAESEFLWFNGCQLVDNFNATTSNGKYIIPGWTTDVFEFYKYIPIFVSSNFKSNESVSLNVDYDINISGDTDKSKRSILINGNVNCEVLSSDIISANKEFKNIYTKDEIISEKGILLGYNSDDDTSAISIYDNGNINTDGDIVTNAITAKTNINTNKLSALGQDDGTIITNNVIVGSSAKPNLLNISTKPQFNTIDINIDNVENIDISRSNIGSTIITDSNVVVKKGGILSVTNKDVIATGINSNTNSGEATPVDDSDWMIDTFDEIKYKEIKSLFDNTSISSSFTMTEKTKADNESEFYASAYNAIYYKDVEKYDNHSFDFKYNTSDHSGTTYTKRKALQFKLKRPTDNKTYNFDLSTITIQLAKMGFAMGLYSHCSYGKWPVLVNDSNMKFRVVIEYGNNTANDEFVCTDKYKFNNSLKADKIVDDCSYAWTTGYTTDGNYVSSSNYEGWRYKIYHVSPYNITISNSTILSHIKTCYDSNKTVTISVYPEFEIYVKAQNGWRNVCDDVKILRMYEAGNNNSRSYTMTEQSGWNHDAYRNQVKAEISKITYKLYNQYDSINDVNATSLCNDGIVMKHGNTVFGLGFAEKATNYYYDGRSDKDYERDGNNKGFYKSFAGGLKNEPILFYYTTVNDDSSTNKNKYTSNHAQYINTINEGNVQMMINSITLRELFELVKHAKITPENAWKPFGL